MSAPRDGFWAFEMERRHAASVVATGADASFDAAREALGSSVERRAVDVADLSPETVGEFDVVFCGALATRTRDPVAALAAVRSVCRELLVLEDALDATMSRVRRRTPTAVLDGALLRGGRSTRPGLAAWPSRPGSTSSPARSGSRRTRGRGPRCSSGRSSVPH